MKKVLTDEIINKLNEHEYIVLGVSGGVDSVVLLDMFMKDYRITNSRLVVAHVNHGIREESEVEYDYLKKFCSDNDLYFESVKLNTEENPELLGNSEKFARDLRYAFYKEVLAKYETTNLVLGHHGDDLVETVLMRLVRGSQGTALIGMSLINEMQEFTVIRPLLVLEKKEIYDYAEDNLCFYFEDESNQSTKYTRNRFRKLLPLLKEENNKVHEQFLNYSQTKKEEEEFINDFVEKLYLQNIKKCENNGVHYIKFNKEFFNGQMQIIKKRLIERIFETDLNTLYTQHTFGTFMENLESINTDFMLINSGVYMAGNTEIYIFKKSEMLKIRELNTDKEILENKNERINGKKISKYVSEKKVPVALRNPLYVDRGTDGIILNVYNSLLEKI